ncbi:hypothetical protein WME77_35735 [Sorangium sp. So ce764]|uniref:hypothetical protein n=1 Tax=Sorangium sp. So ce764 TaxID=3133320 RepID=UPI003F627BB7
MLGGSFAEVLCGAATIVLAIIGLTGILPGELTSIATIVFGAALIAHGGAIASRFGALTRATPPVEWDTRGELGGGLGAELVCGAACSRSSAPPRSCSASSRWSASIPWCSRSSPSSSWGRPSS